MKNITITQNNQNNQKIIKNWKTIEKYENIRHTKKHKNIKKYVKHEKYQKHKNIENIGRGVWKLGNGKTPDSLPEHEHPNTPKTRTMVGLTALYNY